MTIRRLALLAFPLVLLAGCEDEKPKPTAPSAKPAAINPVPAASMSAAAEAEKPKTAAPKKTLADCPKGEAIAFDDKKLEEAVRLKVQKPTGDVTKADLGKLKSMNLSQATVN